MEEQTGSTEGRDKEKLGPRGAGVGQEGPGTESFQHQRGGLDAGKGSPSDSSVFMTSGCGSS